MKNAIFSNMNWSRDYHTKWSKPDKDKCYTISLISGIFKNDIKELIYKIEIDLQTLKINLQLKKVEWGRNI